MSQHDECEQAESLTGSQPTSASPLDASLPAKIQSALAPPTWLGVLVLAATYVAAAWLGLQFESSPGYVIAFWPAAGVALMALLLFGYRLWPGVLLGSMCVDLWIFVDAASALTNAGPVAVSVAIGLGAAAQALLGAWLVRRFIGHRPPLVNSGEIAGFLSLGGPLSCVINATWGTAVLVFAGEVPRSDALFTAWTWWTGDVFGVLIVAPLALIWLGRQEPLWRRRRWSVALPLAIVLVLVMGMFAIASQKNKQQIESRFTQRSIVAASALEKNLARYLDAVRSIRDLFASSDRVTRADFRQFVSHSLRAVPGIQALSWNPLVSGEQRRGFETAVRGEVGRSFVLTERDPSGALLPAAERDLYVVVNFIEPALGNESALGYDVYSNARRRTAMHQARDSGKPVVTGRISLLQQQDGQLGVLVFWPVYTSAEPPATLSARRAELRGFAVGVFRVDEILASAFETTQFHDMVAQLFDLSARAGERFLAGFPSAEEGSGSDLLPGEATGLSQWSRNFEIGGREWQLVLFPTAVFVAGERNLAARFLLAVGVLLIGLFEGVLLGLSGRAELDARRAVDAQRINRALKEEIAQRAQVERALFDEKERAEVTLQSIGDAVITTDPKGTIDYLNPVAEALTEWSLDDACGMPLESVFRIISEETRQPASNPIRRCLLEGRIVGLANHTALISRSGKEYSIQDSAAPIREAGGNVVGVILVFNDVSQSRRMAREAEHYATHDDLTGLVNRREFSRRLEQAVSSSKTYGSQHALCYLDLDQFKIVNDTAGHHAGDVLLQELAAHLLREIRDRDSLARLGGDEFGLLLDNCPLAMAIEIAQSLVASIRDFSFAWQERSFEVGVSIGLVPIDANVGSSEELLAQADVACYAAKDLGGNRVHLYATDTDGVEPRHTEIMHAADMRAAIDEKRFRLFAQPIYAIAGDDLTPVRREILLRMVDKDGELINASAFIPAAERYGLMGAIDRWVIKEVCANYQSICANGASRFLAINLSGNSLSDDSLLPYVQAQFAAHHIDASHICFEITETSAIRNLAGATRFIATLRQIGCQFALDDFGTGLSSFGYLKSLPVDCIKIDGRFVRDVENDRGDRAMITAIVQVAHAMGIRTIAEQVETPGCVEILRELGVDDAQGFALGRPESLPKSG